MVRVQELEELHAHLRGGELGQRLGLVVMVVEVMGLHEENVVRLVVLADGLQVQNLRRRTAGALLLVRMAPGHEQSGVELRIPLDSGYGVRDHS